MGKLTFENNECLLMRLFLCLLFLNCQLGGHSLLQSIRGGATLKPTLNI